MPNGISKRELWHCIRPCGTAHWPKIGAKLCRLILMSAALPASSDKVLAPVPGGNLLAQQQKHRPVTIEDAIRMTRLADPAYLCCYAKPSIAKFSPDGKKFVVLLRKGNLEANTNEYSLVLFRTDEIFNNPKARTLFSFASSSNRPAIQQPTWLEDNDTILFLGEHIGELTQLHSFKCSSKELKTLTHHPTNLNFFATNSAGTVIVYSAESPPVTILTPETLRTGIRITHAALVDLIKGTSTRASGDSELFVRGPGSTTFVRVYVEGQIFPFSELFHQIFVSPNGQYALLQTEVGQIPPHWLRYKDKLFQGLSSRASSSGIGTGIHQYELVNTRTGKSRRLLDSPVGPLSSESVWLPDSQSVVISNVYLPLKIDDFAQLDIRRSHRFLVEVTVPNLEIASVSEEDIRLLGWDEKTRSIMGAAGRLASFSGKAAQRVSLHKNGDTWIATKAGLATADRPQIVLEEDINTPPHIWAVDPLKDKKVELLDLNPQFRDLAFARTEEVDWKDRGGNVVEGGLYWPLEYQAGKKYPLVIQTHGFNRDRFWIDGPWTTAFAAQPLAAKNVFVLQAPDPDLSVIGTVDEGPRAMSMYEGAVDYLDGRGLIDKDQVGLIGFSRTAYYVMYTLTHSIYHFAAAAITDGVDGGYVQHLMFAPNRPIVAADSERLNGSAPFGDGLEKWLKRSPGFLIERVRTPVRIEAIGPTSLLTEWGLFSAMSWLGKPVDMIYIPDGTHILEKPWDREISQQGNVDWFCFWLKGEEDSRARKDEQYARWHDLRSMSRKPSRDMDNHESNDLIR